jgi:hypothetical protein
VSSGRPSGPVGPPTRTIRIPAADHDPDALSRATANDLLVVVSLGLADEWPMAIVNRHRQGLTASWQYTGTPRDYSGDDPERWPGRVQAERRQGSGCSVARGTEAAGTTGTSSSPRAFAVASSTARCCWGQGSLTRRRASGRLRVAVIGLHRSDGGGVDARRRLGPGAGRRWGAARTAPCTTIPAPAGTSTVAGSSACLRCGGQQRPGMTSRSRIHQRGFESAWRHCSTRPSRFDSRAL